MGKFFAYFHSYPRARGTLGHVSVFAGPSNRIWPRLCSNGSATISSFFSTYSHLPVFPQRARGLAIQKNDDHNVTFTGSYNRFPRVLIFESDETVLIRCPARWRHTRTGCPAVLTIHPRRARKCQES